MSTWLLSCTPKKFDLEGHRRDGHVLSSRTVVRYVSELAAGDEFVMWVGGPHAGGVAYGRFTGPAVEVRRSAARPPALPQAGSERLSMLHAGGHGKTSHHMHTAGPP